jgi:hypothetical protein
MWTANNGIASTDTMAAFDHSLLPRAEATLHLLMKRKNWAAKNPGVILVFAIVATVVILLVGLNVMKRMQARAAAKA